MTREGRAMLGERLEMARKMRGLSQQDLAEQVGLSRMAISKYENDKNVPGSQNLLNLAKALDVKVEYLLRPVSLYLSEPVFRKKASFPKKQEKKIIHQTQDWLERYLQVESLFGIESKYEQPEIDGKVTIIEDVERIAVDLREIWKLGLDPIESMMDLLEENGIKVWSIDQDLDHFDAAIMWINDESPVFVCKEGVPGDRQRYNLAHELGHLILNPGEDIDEEKAAHRFAGAFLVPRSKVYEELGKNRNNISYQELFLLKHKYGLSMQAWIYRAKDLGVISQSKYKKMFIDLSKKGWREIEPGDPVESEKPGRMDQLVLRALAEGVITRSRAGELLNRSIKDLEKMGV